jgi:uncharacterized integral membrane protein
MTELTTDAATAGAEPAGSTRSTDPPITPSEPAGRRRARHAHRALLYVCALLVIVLLVAVIVLSAANAEAVTLDGVVGSTSVSLVWIVVGATVTGWVIGIATAVLFRFRTRNRTPKI